MAKKKKEVVILDAEIVEEVTTPDFSDTEIYTGPGKKPQGTRKKDYPKFTAKNRENILALLAKGNPPSYAANIVGITMETIKRWLEKGRNIQILIEDGYEEGLNPVDIDFADFCIDFNKMYTVPRMRLLQINMNAALGDPEKGIPPNLNVAKVMLEKQDPEHFGQKSAVDIREDRYITVTGSAKQLPEGEEKLKELSTEEVRFLWAEFQKKKTAKMLSAGDEEDAE